LENKEVDVLINLKLRIPLSNLQAVEVSSTISMIGGINTQPKNLTAGAKIPAVYWKLF
jgi:hypothetical protein